MYAKVGDTLFRAQSLCSTNQDSALGYFIWVAGTWGTWDPPSSKDTAKTRQNPEAFCRKLTNSDGEKKSKFASLEDPGFLLLGFFGHSFFPRAPLFYTEKPYIMYFLMAHLLYFMNFFDISIFLASRGPERGHFGRFLACRHFGAT